MNLSDGEKLIMLMLADVSKALEMEGENPQFIQKTIANDDLWALRWKYHGAPFSKHPAPPEVAETCEILEMWSVVESSFAALSPTEKKRVKYDAYPFGNDVQFHGFYGNHDPHTSIARVLIEDLGLWTEFKGRSPDDHARTLEHHMRMYHVFESVCDCLHSRRLNADEIIRVLTAQKYT
ncbi:YfbU family protein [Bradyrhizobium sp. STM 3562]|uniref:YfbU family protein n=1 Tax=Bradyrhizobium sp. STM 3562 TaxID=578924 RepID=UPI00388F57B1